MKVLHVCSISPSTGQTGYEIRIIEEVRLIRQRGVKVAILCFVRRDQFFPLRRLLTMHRRLRRSTGAQVFIIPTTHFFDLEFPESGDPGITRAIVSIARLCRVTLVHGQALYSTMHILRARAKLSVRVVFDVHGASPEETEMSGGAPNRVQMLAKWEQEALCSADYFNFVSRRMNHHFSNKYRLDVHNYSVIPCCVHTDRFRMTWDIREEMRNRLGLANRFVLGYLGTLTVWQWPDAMFALASQIRQHLPETFLYLLIPECDHPKAYELLRKHEIPSNAFRIEEVPHDRVGSVLGIIDAGLLLRECHPVNEVASPTKFGEYLAAGVPVIATGGIGDTSEIVGKEQVGIIIAASNTGADKEQMKSLTAFIDELMRHRNEFASRCTATAQRVLDWNECGKILTNVYQRLIDRRM